MARVEGTLERRPPLEEPRSAEEIRIDLMSKLGGFPPQQSNFSPNHDGFLWVRRIFARTRPGSTRRNHKIWGNDTTVIRGI